MRVGCILILSLWSVVQGFAQLADYPVISEIRYDERSGVKEEFVELYNPTSETVHLSGMYFAYKSKEGETWRTKITFDETHLIEAAGFFLWGAAEVMPVPDVIHPSDLKLSNSGGHLALFDAEGVVVDLIAWEGGLTPEGAMSAEKTPDGGSLERKACEAASALTMAAGGIHAQAGNGWDSNENGLDFVVHEAEQCNPQNSSSPAEIPVCGPEPEGDDSGLGLIRWPSVQSWEFDGVTLCWESNAACLSTCYYGLNGLLTDSLTGNAASVQHAADIAGFQPGDLITYQIRLHTDSSSVRLLPGTIALPVAESTGSIQVYFNGSVHPDYVELQQAAGDEDLAAHLVNLIDGAQYTLDFCFMKLTEWDVRDALIRAHQRGVQVRMICDQTYFNYDEIKALQAESIPVISDDYGANQGDEGIMHHKFVVVDYAGLTAADDKVWTGSYNATYYGSNPPSLENVMIIEDQSLAAVYTEAFNVMWGSNTLTPDPAASRFGCNCPDRGPALLSIGGRSVEVVISPSSASIARLSQCVKEASSSCLFGLYSFTHDSMAAALLNQCNESGCYVAGIWDEEQIDDDDRYAQWPSFLSQSGNCFKKDGYAGKFHHKYLIGDALLSEDDAFTATGSMNWSYSGEHRNDENLIIVYDLNIANQYLQEFAARFEEAGGTLPPLQSRIAFRDVLPETMTLLPNFPNPFNPRTRFSYNLPVSSQVSLRVYDIHGRLVDTVLNEHQGMGSHEVVYDAGAMASGVYVYALRAGGRVKRGKMMLVK